MNRARLAFIVLLVASCTRGGGRSATSEDFEVGGPRPVTVRLPSHFDPAVPAPLLILLHGYSGEGRRAARWLGLQDAARKRGLLFAAPDGTLDRTGKRFWEAGVCCNRYGAAADDVAYLTGLIDEISRRVRVDPARVFVVGHSNGGFMAYKLACDASDRLAAVVSLGAAMALDPASCKAGTVSALEIHGDRDTIVPYGGGKLFSGSELPTARNAAERLARLDGCGDSPLAGPARHLERGLAGQETSSLVFSGCRGGAGVELWTVAGGEHNPDVTGEFADAVIDFLLAHPRRP